MTLTENKIPFYHFFISFKPSQCDIHIRLAVKLEAKRCSFRQRWLLICQKSDAYSIFGLDIRLEESENPTVTVGCVLQLSRESRISLDGDGGIFFLSDPHTPSGKVLKEFHEIMKNLYDVKFHFSNI